MVNKKVVCLGGGIGTANLLAGIKNQFSDVTAIVSMADDGGSAGRLRRYYKTFPPGDVINCMIALSSESELMKDLLRFRFSGNRYGPDNILPGQKLGNLILVALTSIKGDFNKGLLEMQKIFRTKGKIFPSTAVPISIWAKTSTGHIVTREENIDRGFFKGQIKKLFIKPKNPPVINELGIKKATEKAFRKAISDIISKTSKRSKYSILDTKYYLLADGFHIKYIRGIGFANQKAITKGDRKSISIAAASIIAKVHRDKLMRKLNKKYPQYGLYRNKGYGTKFHQTAIKNFGLSEIHRTSFNLQRFLQ